MMKKILIPIVTHVVLLAAVLPGLCLTDGDIDLLRKSGIGGETIALMVSERSVETGSFTVREIVNLKRSGMSEKNIRALVKEVSRGKSPAPIVYGKSTLKQRMPSTDEIIALKKAGVSDAVIQAMIISSAPKRDNADVMRAWQMLDKMNLRVDQR